MQAELPLIGTVRHQSAMKKIGFVFPNTANLETTEKELLAQIQRDDLKDTILLELPIGWKYLHAQLFDKNGHLRAFANHRNGIYCLIWIFAIQTDYRVDYDSLDGMLTLHQEVSLKRSVRYATSKVTVPKKNFGENPEYLQLNDQAYEWMSKNYPNHNEPFAYWDD